jgi:V/A-type H+-transporting ATPase subunit D
LANKVLPTKSQLIATKKQLKLSKKGYELMDRKRNVLIREIMQLLDEAGKIQDKIDVTFQAAYDALQLANITLGNTGELASTIPFDDGLNVAYRSVMGVELPMVDWVEVKMDKVPYGLHSSNVSLDDAFLKFVEVKRMSAELAEIENSVFRLSDAIKKTTRRANALKNIMIPRFQADIKFINEVLEEREREEFSRMKMIKKKKVRVAEEAAEAALKAEQATA